MLLLPTHSTLRSPLLQVHHQLHSHRKHSKIHTCKALSKGTPRGFLTSKCYLFYSQEYRVTNICNPNTSVKYLYKLHSPALKAFAQHCMAHSCETCIWYGAICMHWWFFFLPNTSINDIRLLWSEKHNRGDKGDPVEDKCQNSQVEGGKFRQRYNLLACAIHFKELSCLC